MINGDGNWKIIDFGFLQKAKNNYKRDVNAYLALFFKTLYPNLKINRHS